MSTLTTASLVPLLLQLFPAAGVATSPAAALSNEEREHLLRSKTEYLDVRARWRDLRLSMPISDDVELSVRLNRSLEDVSSHPALDL